MEWVTQEGSDIEYDLDGDSESIEDDSADEFVPANDSFGSDSDDNTYYYRITRRNNSS